MKRSHTGIGGIWDTMLERTKHIEQLEHELATAKKEAEVYKQDLIRQEGVSISFYKQLTEAKQQIEEKDKQISKIISTTGKKIIELEEGAVDQSKRKRLKLQMLRNFEMFQNCKAGDYFELPARVVENVNREDMCEICQINDQINCVLQAGMACQKYQGSSI